MAARSVLPKRETATELWKLMLDCSMAQWGAASDVLHEHGLTPGHLKLLVHLAPRVGRAMGELAQTFRCDASTVTWLVDRLEERGFVERRMLPSDRRVKTVALTPVGIEVREELMKRLYEPPRELLALDRSALEGVCGALQKLRASTETRASQANSA